MIHIENLKYKYQGAKQYVFDNFSLNLEDNNIYGLLGKNGTGKSTLLYLIYKRYAAPHGRHHNR